ncbi:MAG: zinc ABC transporter substrate-binding protein [Boseongicola sp.]|nr:zinc ABC transporter substrate-binding protein [Boseongicola sp.]
MVTRRTLLRGLGSGIVAAGLPAPAAAAAERPLKVVATTGMIADTARRVGGDLVEVKALMGPGVDPHSYRQTRTDIVATAKADLVLWNGLYLEAQMEDVLAELARRVPVAALAEAVPADRRIAHDDYTGRFDPHVWMDPGLWRLAAVAARDALTSVKPDGAEAFAANADVLLAELDRLDAYSARVLSTVPEAARVLVTAHDAFNYFGRAYGFEVVGIQGISTESETGLNRMTELVDLIAGRRIAAVFVESSVSDRLVRALVEGAAAAGWNVRIGGELYSDAMGADGTYEGTYVGMIDHNVTVIAGGLGGSVPPRGMSGRLSAGS